MDQDAVLQDLLNQVNELRAQVQNQNPPGNAGQAPPAPPLPQPYSKFGYSAPFPDADRAPFQETDGQRIPFDIGKKNMVILPVQDASSRITLMNLMRTNLHQATQCASEVLRTSFYMSCIDLSKVTSMAKQSKWARFQQQHDAEFRAVKDMREEMIFHYTVVDFFLETFCTEPLKHDAANQFDSYKQRGEQCGSDLVANMVNLAVIGGKILFLDEKDDGAEQEMTKNVHIVISALYNDDVKEAMRKWVPYFVSGVPSQENFEKMLRIVMTSQRQIYQQTGEKSRAKLKGLKYTDHEVCMSEEVDSVEVDACGIQHSVPASGEVIQGAPDQSNITKIMICRRCGWGAHPANRCPAVPGTKNSVGRVLVETPDRFAKEASIFFSSLAARKYGDRQAARGNYRGRGGFRGGFRGGNRGGRGGGHQASLNVVADDGYVEDGYYAEVDQEGYTEEVEGEPAVEEPASLN